MKMIVEGGDHAGQLLAVAPGTSIIRSIADCDRDRDKITVGRNESKFRKLMIVVTESG